MSLKAVIQQTNEAPAKWVDYKNAEGEVLAEFKIKGIDNQAYRVAVERASNQITSKGFDVSLANKEDKLYHELIIEAAACHLIEDWKKIVFVEKGEEIEVAYTQENAIKLLSMGDIGIIIWSFVKEQADKIQKESDKLKDEILGK